MSIRNGQDITPSQAADFYKTWSSLDEAKIHGSLDATELETAKKICLMVKGDKNVSVKSTDLVKLQEHLNNSGIPKKQVKNSIFRLHFNSTGKVKSTIDKIDIWIKEKKIQELIKTDPERAQKQLHLLIDSIKNLKTEDALDQLKELFSSCSYVTKDTLGRAIMDLLEEKYGSSRSKTPVAKDDLKYILLISCFERSGIESSLLKRGEALLHKIAPNSPEVNVFKALNGIDTFAKEITAKLNQKFDTENNSYNFNSPYYETEVESVIGLGSFLKLLGDVDKSAFKDLNSLAKPLFEKWNKENQQRGISNLDLDNLNRFFLLDTGLLKYLQSP